VSATLRAAHSFLERVGNGNGNRPRVLAVATEAVRIAENRDGLLGALRRREGVEVHVLSGREEGRLGALAALHSLPVRNGLVMDLGGGSLQLTRVVRRRIGPGASLPLGAIRLTRTFLRGDPPSTRQVQALRREVRYHLEHVGGVWHAGDRLIGLGGTVRTLARIHLATTRRLRKSRHGLELTQADVTAVRACLEPLAAADRRRIRGLKAERADVILAGVLTIEELMIHGGYFTLTVCTRGVRDGLLLCETMRRRL
jgi:exopolyphosphatase/guanosine-5'-triphosphate,3'-diphosphate pyrophosphatase